MEDALSDETAADVSSRETVDDGNFEEIVEESLAGAAGTGESVVSGKECGVPANDIPPRISEGPGGIRFITGYHGGGFLYIFPFRRPDTNECNLPVG